MYIENFILISDCTSAIIFRIFIKLLIDLAKEGYTVRNPYKGIYYLGRKVSFATQIIVSKELTGSMQKNTPACPKSK